MSRNNQATMVLSLLITVLSGGLTGCTNKRRTEPAAPERVNDISVLVLQQASVPDWLEVVGTVRAAQTSQLASRMMGNIVEIRTHEGERVQSGQVLAVIDDAQPRSAMEQATAAVT